MQDVMHLLQGGDGPGVSGCILSTADASLASIGLAGSGLEFLSPH